MPKKPNSRLLVSLVLVVVVIAVLSPYVQTQVPAWEQVTIGQLLANPAQYSGHLVRTNGYVVECTCSPPSFSCPFGCPKYSLYENGINTPSDPHIALSWSGTVDPLANYVSGWSDGQTISCSPPCTCTNPPCVCPMMCRIPQQVWVIGTFTDRGQIQDAPRYVLIITDVSWFGSTTITPVCPPYQCPIGQVYDASCHCITMPTTMSSGSWIGSVTSLSEMIWGLRVGSDVYALLFHQPMNTLPGSGDVIQVWGTLGTYQANALLNYCTECVGAIDVSNWVVLSNVITTTNQYGQTSVITTTVAYTSIYTQHESCASMQARGGCGTCDDGQGHLVSYECPIGPQFPTAPQSLSDVPRFLSQFWAWVSCRYFGHC